MNVRARSNRASCASTATSSRSSSPTSTLPKLGDYLREICGPADIHRPSSPAPRSGASSRARSSASCGRSLILCSRRRSTTSCSSSSVVGGRHGSGPLTSRLIIGSVFFFNFTRIAISEGGRSILRHKGLVLNAIFPRGAARRLGGVQGPSRDMARARHLRRHPRGRSARPSPARC